MEPDVYLDFLHMLEKMKCNTRHSWTSTGRHESVAEHSYRLAVMAFLLRDELPGIDMEKVLLMCLVHDWGEAVTGDVPSFLKTGADEKTEDEAVDRLLARLPEREAELKSLFSELTALETPEARVYKALDKLEAVIQHNEAPLSTWLPLERELNISYGEAECCGQTFLAKLRAQVRRDTEEKLAE
ncbi:MAG: HD domain-containing protein [Clostridia bacterium]|nr:HD domain-containing protein [Clostridia bacterium]